MQERLNSLTETIIGAAVDVHRALGPGMLESSYALMYKGRTLDVAYRLDLLVDGLGVVEVKAIDRLERVHSAQLLSYLRCTGCKVGLLFNFNVNQLVLGGLKRIVNGFPE